MYEYTIPMEEIQMIQQPNVANIITRETGCSTYHSILGMLYCFCDTLIFPLECKQSAMVQLPNVASTMISPQNIATCWCKPKILSTWYTPVQEHHQATFLEVTTVGYTHITYIHAYILYNNYIYAIIEALLPVLYWKYNTRQSQMLYHLTIIYDKMY